MTIGIADTTVIIHLFRKNAAARAWMEAQAERLSITPYTWLEIIYGAPGKRGQAACLAIMKKFDLVFPVRADIEWAMLAYRLSHGVSVVDCLIASVAHRLQVPLYTDNVKDFPMLAAKLVVKPY
jgi:predicted nucleic acid-binding protein